MERDFHGYLGERARALDSAPSLTRRQLAVIFLVSHGMRYREIGETLHLSEATCIEVANKARRRLEARTIPHTVATALRLGLIE